MIEQPHPRAVWLAQGHLRAYIPLRNLSRGYRETAREAIKLARSLGITSIDWEPKPEPVAPQPGQTELFHE